MKRFLTVATGIGLIAAALLNANFGSSEKSFSAEANNQIAQVKVSTHTVTEQSVKIVTGFHTVVSGETLSAISQSELGNEELFSVIFDQNQQSLDATAISHGFVSSEGGHWIFPGEVLSISLPEIITTSQTVTDQATITDSEAIATATSSPTQTLTSTTTPPTSPATPTATEAAEMTSTATETETPVVTLTVTPINTSTRVPTSTASATATSTETLSVATETETSTATATATVTSVPFVFSPSLPLDAQPGITFYISTSFGEMSYGRPHRGVDIAARERVGGFAIKAVAEGIVTQSGWNGTYGYSVTIAHPDGKTSLYGHMRKTPSVAVRDTVVKGQLLGYMDTTGFSDGNHLHLEMTDKGKLVNPKRYLDLSEQNLNFIPPPPTPIAVPEKVQLLRVDFFDPLLPSRFLDLVRWQFAVARNQEFEHNKQIWIWNSEVARQKQINDLLATSFVLTPMQTKPQVDDSAVLTFISQLKYYTVKRGDSLSLIGSEVGVDPNVIAWLNKIDLNGILAVDQKLALPPQSHDPVVSAKRYTAVLSDPLGLGYQVGPDNYVPFLREMASLYGANFDQLFTVINDCENGHWNANDYHMDSGSYTGGIGQFKEPTYRNNATAMGLGEAEIVDWLNPYNQLRVMAWMFANGSAGNWSCYRAIYGR